MDNQIINGIIENTSTVSYIKRFNPTINQWDSVNKSLKDNTKLIELHINETRIPPEMVYGFSNSISQNHTLTILDISICKLNCDSMQHIFNSLKNNQTLITFDISGNLLNPQDFIQLSAIPLNVRELTINDIIIGENVFDLIKGLNMWQNLTKLELCHNGLTDAIIDKMSENSQIFPSKLEQLKILDDKLSQQNLIILQIKLAEINITLKFEDEPIPPFLSAFDDDLPIDVYEEIVNEQPKESSHMETREDDQQYSNYQPQYNQSNTLPHPQIEEVEEEDDDDDEDNLSFLVRIQQVDDTYETKVKDLCKLIRALSDNSGHLSEFRTPTEIGFDFFAVIAFLKQRIQSTILITDNKSCNVNPPAVINILNNNIPYMYAILKMEPYLQCSVESESLPKILNNTVGKQERCGIIKLRCIELLAELVRIGYESTLTLIITLSIPPYLLDFFDKYPWNNAVHLAVEKIFLHLLASKSDEVLLYIIDKCQLTTKIIKWFDDYQNRPNPRKELWGFRGHLIRLSNGIVKLSSDRELLRNKLESVQGWDDFVKSKLDKYNIDFVGRLDGDGYLIDYPIVL